MDLELYKPIVAFLDGYKMRHIDILANEDSTSRYTALFEAMRRQEVNTDAEAAKFIFDEKTTAQSGKYRTFKSVFKDKLLNTLLFIDTTTTAATEQQKAFFAVQREWSAVSILYSRNLHATANALTEKLLQTAMQYHMIELCMTMTSMLAGVYANVLRNKKDYVRIKSLNQHYTALFLAEQQAREAFNDLRVEYLSAANYKPEIADLAKKSYEALAPYLEKFDSVYLNLYIRILEATMYSEKRDFENLFEVSCRAVAYFEQAPFHFPRGKTIFLNQKMLAAMALKRYDEADATIIAALQMQVTGDFNWFKSQELRIYLLLRMHRYTEGYAVFEEVQATAQYQSLKSPHSDIWKLFEAYFYLLMLEGHIDSATLRDFKLQRFLNNIPHFTKDKEGMNISVMIIQIMLMIVTEAKRHDLIDKIEAIEKYKMRYTAKESGHFRYNQFVKMILEIPKSGFMKKILLQRTRQLYKDMSMAQYNILEADYKIECLPLEVLWAIILKKLS